MVAGFAFSSVEGLLLRGASFPKNTRLAIAFCLMLPACDNSPPAERRLLLTTESLLRSHDPGDDPVRVEYASQAPDKSSVCGFATIGDRNHIPYIVQILPGGAMATVDLVMKTPFKGQPAESEGSQAARILLQCKQLGHNLP
jgi:hypothetical protein